MAHHEHNLIFQNNIFFLKREIRQPFIRPTFKKYFHINMPNTQAHSIHSYNQQKKLTNWIWQGIYFLLLNSPQKVECKKILSNRVKEIDWNSIVASILVIFKCSMYQIDVSFSCACSTVFLPISKVWIFVLESLGIFFSKHFPNKRKI